MISRDDPRHRHGSDQSFTFISDDFAGVFLVDLMMRELIGAHGDMMDELICESPMFQNVYDHIMANNGIEERRVLRFTPEFRDRPCIVAEFPGQPPVMIDGNHRYVRLWRDGVRKFNFYLIPRAVWKDYLLDVPEDVVRGIDRTQDSRVI